LIHSASFKAPPRKCFSRVVGPDKKTYTFADVRNPGPGYYNDNKSFKELTPAPKYTLRPKTQKECNDKFWLLLYFSILNN
jgi:hypothetical protein